MFGGIPSFFQNTYTNADKLLEAAEQLAQTGECDPEEIYKAARHLEVRIQDFVRRVEHRKLLLDMSVSYHTHTKEVGCPNTHKHKKKHILTYPAATCEFYLNVFLIYSAEKQFPRPQLMALLSVKWLLVLCSISSCVEVV